MCFDSFGTMPRYRFVVVKQKKKKDGPVGEPLHGDVFKFTLSSQTQQQKVTDYLQDR